MDVDVDVDVVGEGEELPEPLVDSVVVAVVVGRMDAAAPIPVNATGMVGCQCRNQSVVSY